MLTIKHLGLSTEPITLLDQAINLFPSLQYTLNRLMQHDLRLIQFFLNFHYAVRLLRILIFLKVFFELWKGEVGIGVGVGEGGARIAGEELVNDFGKQLMCDKGRIVRIADYDSGNAFCAAIGMECVGWNGMSVETQTDSGVSESAGGTVHFSSTSCL